MKNLDTDKYNRAKKRMEAIKGFYSHLTVYIIINSVLLLFQAGLAGGFVNLHIPSWSAITTPFFWGIGLFFHGLYVFQNQFPFLKNWEDRKIEEFMKEDEESFKNTFNK